VPTETMENHLGLNSSKDREKSFNRGKYEPYLIAESARLERTPADFFFWLVERKFLSDPPSLRSTIPKCAESCALVMIL